MDVSKYICFDCETTGLEQNCNLLTLCLVILDNNLNQIDMLNISLKQDDGYTIFPEALVINKINLIEHHNNSTTLSESRIKLFNFLNLNKTFFNLIPIGHNLKFDIDFIKKSGLLTELEYNNYISCNFIDTITIAQFLKLSGKLHPKQSISLVNLCNIDKLNLKIDKTQEHSAEYDTKMTISLLKSFVDLIKEEKTEDKDKNKNKKRKHD